MVKLNKNSYILKWLKGAQRVLHKYRAKDILGKGDETTPVGLFITFLYFALFIASIPTYGTHNEQAAILLLIIYSVIIFLAALKNQYSVLVAIVTFCIPIFACGAVLVTTPKNMQTKCAKVEKMLEEPDTEHLKYWYKHSCGSK